ncbi:CRISPR-associated helicase Cas3' [Rothia sp. LK2588]|uniref:CRISPR-associated helicase Cas3' n=1 Tax=Rothia sp. LK2588 TaxID=3114369 RepID=UPI0034CE85DD
MNDFPALTWSPAAASLWAKTGQEEDEWLCLPQHMMDSAMVGSYLWDHWVGPGVRKHAEDKLELSTEETTKFVSWVCGLHDVGKASVPFAAQVSKQQGRAWLCDQIEQQGLPLPRNVAENDWYPHSAESRAAWAFYAEEHFGTHPRFANHLGDIFGAHHGLPASSEMMKRSTDRRENAPDWIRVQDELISNIIEFTKTEEVLKKLMNRKYRPGSDLKMILTGVVIMADWIASNADFFPLVGAPSGDNNQRFATGISRVSLPGPWQPRGFDTASADDAYRASFGWPETVAPRPMQRATFDIARKLEAPALICIEAPMGNGKTEAALLASEILAHKTGRSGVFFGAPTMATSDSLFSRTKAWAQLGEAGVTSMYLGHSKNQLNAEFGSMPRRSRMRVAPEGTPNQQDCSDHTDVIAHQWLWGRKKGILSNMVVGTVDQILMLALQSKHAMLRHLGLASKVVVIDEVHSYDAFMGSYLAKALQWLGYYGVPVVLLSATLPHSIKSQLVTAYHRGLRGSDRESIEVPETGLSYPVITTATAHGVEVSEVEQSASVQTFSVQPVNDDKVTLRSLLEPVAEKGGCVLVLCNTVARAQEAFTVAQDVVGDDARLLHARFTAIERVGKEQDLVEELGPRANRDHGRPACRVVVATQVVEQSLDVDFDCIITDVAPIDLLLQRMGRVHRHARPESDRPAWAREPRVYIRGMQRLGTETTPPEFSRGVDAVYHPAILLPTCSELCLVDESSAIKVSLPHDIPKLVQAVYSNPQVHPGWQEAYGEARHDLENELETSQRRASTFQFPPPFKNPPFVKLWQGNKQDATEEEGVAQVRDTDPTIEVVLTRATGDGYYSPLPWLDSELADQQLARGTEPDRETARLLATSTVRLPYQFSRYPSLFDQAISELEENTDRGWEKSLFLKGQLQLNLDHNFSATISGLTVQYSPELGLQLLTPSYSRKEQE